LIIVGLVLYISSCSMCTIRHMDIHSIKRLFQTGIDCRTHVNQTIYGMG